jgi:cation:H+ antiporter
MLVPLAISKSTVRIELPFNILLSLALFAMLLRGPDYSLDRFDGFILIIFLLIFMEYTFVMAKNDRIISKAAKPDEAPVDVEKRKNDRVKNLVLTLIGLAMVVFGANVTVNAATKIALGLGISEALVGLSMVAIGTSLPELVTSLSAALKHQSDLAIGNIVGSNIFNIGLILGFSSMVKPISVSMNLYWVDILVMAMLAVALLLTTLKRSKVTKVEGALFFCSYIGYLVFIAIRG